MNLSSKGVPSIPRAGYHMPTMLGCLPLATTEAGEWMQSWYSWFLEMVQRYCGVARWAYLGGCVHSVLFTLSCCGGGGAGWGRRRDWVLEDSWELVGPGGILLEMGLFWLLDNPCKVAWRWATEESKGMRMYLGNWGQIHWLPHLPGLPECVLGIRLCWWGEVQAQRTTDKRLSERQTGVREPEKGTKGCRVVRQM